MKVKIVNYDKEYTFSKSVTPKDILQKIDIEPKYPFIAALLNNKDVINLNEVLNNDAELEFLDLRDTEASKLYWSSLTFILIRAVKELYPSARVKIHHSLSKGLYCEMYADFLIYESDVKEIEKRMGEIIEEDILFVKESLKKKDAIKLFEEQGQMDKVRLFKYYKDSQIDIYKLKNSIDYFYGPLLPSTSYIYKFGLKYYPPGFILYAPWQKSPDVLPPFSEQYKLFQIYREYERWMKILKVEDVGSLNKHIKEGTISDLIKVGEALHEKKIASIADMIKDSAGEIKIILIAGPSSSGKTTFAKRLGIQLRVNGITPHVVSLDDYFIDRDKTPLCPDGTPDFESIKAINLDMFEHNMNDLLSGKEAFLPKYNFKEGKSSLRNKPLELGENDVLVVEGIHCLNPTLIQNLPGDNFFRIYVSDLTQLNLDDHNRIHTTQTRIVRRLVRDYKYRGHDAEKTILMWPKVRAGEDKNIFPYQENADVIFNSALVFELFVLKKYAEPILKEVQETSEAYRVAKHLLSFFEYFLSIEDDEVPPTSILREFIGGSSFNY